MKGDLHNEGKALRERFERMGIETRLLPGGRCVLATLRLQARTFESLTSAVEIEHVIFASVGTDRIKCLQPRALFLLPILRIADCRHSTAVEARIRLAWKNHIEEMRRTYAWLEQIGSEPEAVESGAALRFALDGEERATRAWMIDSDRIILPSRGPLSGLNLARPEDRTLRVDRTTRSSIDLDMTISTRLEELRRIERRLETERRQAAFSSSTNSTAGQRARCTVRVLLVGPRLSKQRACIESLRLRGYRVDVAHDQIEALAAYNSHSPELVLTDVQLGRSDGTELLLALRHVSGIEEIPVVLVDDAFRAPCRETARRIGAAGYLVHPVDVQRIADRLADLVNQPHRRRFTRYPRRLPVRLAPQVEQPDLVTALGRGGMFVATEHDFALRSLCECEITLPEMGRKVGCQAEVLYQRPPLGRQQRGVGVRFHAFRNADENVLIHYLDEIAQPSA